MLTWSLLYIPSLSLYFFHVHLNFLITSTIDMIMSTFYSKRRLLITLIPFDSFYSRIFIPF